MINLRKRNKKESAPGTANAGTEGAGGVITAPKKKKKKISKKIVIPVVLVLAVAVFFFVRGSKAKKNVAVSTYTTVPVERRSITQALTGSGTLLPANSYTVTSLVQGEILSSPFKEGDKVKKGDILFGIDSSDIATTINRAQITLANQQMAYQTKLKNMDNLNVKASVDGTITNVAVEEGDDVKAGQTIATVTNSSTMTVVLPFPSDDAAGFYIGQPATVTLEGSFEKLSGTITKISATNTILTGNIMTRNVTIDVANPGAISDSQFASATVGDSASSSSKAFTYKNTATITALVSGTVSKINAPEGSWVSKDQTIVTLKSDTLSNDLQNSANSVQDAQLALQNNYDKMDNYNITSPIDGTIVQKNYKLGDTLSDNALKLCIVYDLSYLTVTMNVDELDIKNIKVGQPATVTADAVAGKTFEGIVTKVSSVGTTTSGVTTYPVTIQIDKFGDLLPSMNVSTKIVVSKVDNVLSVPLSSVLRGNRMLVKQDGAPALGGGIPEGFAYVNVVTGLKDGNYIEIKEGLKDGDVIAFTKMAGMSGAMMGSGGASGAPQQQPAQQQQGAVRVG